MNVLGSRPNLLMGTEKLDKRYDDYDDSASAYRIAKFMVSQTPIMEMPSNILLQILAAWPIP